MESGAGELIKTARIRAGLRQQQLAERANVAQSFISAYESGKREPTLPTLRRLVAATGHEVTLGLAPVSDAHRPFSGPIGVQVRRNRGEMREVLRRHGIRGAHVFGSVARGDDRVDSDVDLLVDLPPTVGIFELAALARELGEVAGAPVEVIPRAGLKDDVRDNVLADLVKL